MKNNSGCVLLIVPGAAVKIFIIGNNFDHVFLEKKNPPIPHLFDSSYVGIYVYTLTAADSQF